MPLLVEIAGRSMEPTLLKGWTVWVDPTVTSAAPGDVVLLQGHSAPVVHRVVWTSTIGGRRRIFHRGDCGGGVGVCDGAAIRGRVLAVVAPHRGDLVGLEPSPRQSRRLRYTQLRCRLYALAASLTFGGRSRRLHRLGQIVLGNRPPDPATDEPQGASTNRVASGHVEGTPSTAASTRQMP